MIIHTIPAAKQDVPADKANSSAQNETSASAKGKERMPQSVSNVPRLISVVEIIKREYLKIADTSLVGLYQYNELSTLEDLGLRPDPRPVEEEGGEIARTQAIIQALDGVKKSVTAADILTFD